MKKFKRLIIKILIQLFLVTTVISFYNYLFDFYGVFNRRKYFKQLEPNQRSLKLDFILNGNHSKKGLIFSDSRGGILNQTNNNSDWYNMGYSLGTSEEFQEDIFEILKNRNTIKNIIIFLDELTLFEDYNKHNNQLARKKVKLNSSEVIQFLFVFPNFSVLKSFLFPRFQTVVFDLFNSGSTIEKNFNYDYSKINCYNIKKEKKISEELFKEKIEVLKKIKNECSKNNVRVKFFIHPISSKNYEFQKSKFDMFFSFLDYLILNGIFPNQTTECKVIKFNDKQWRDISHYNRSIGEKIETGVFSKFLNQ